MTSRLSALPTMDVLSDESLALDALALEELLARHGSSKSERTSSPRASTNLPGVVIGTVSDINEHGEPLVRFVHEAHEVIRPARNVVAIDRDQVGAEVALVFEQGNVAKPIILGLLGQAKVTSPVSATPIVAVVDNEKLELTADREIVLRCGKASITLTRAGKVLIRGAYLLSRSSGVNRVKGGVVHVN